MNSTTTLNVGHRLGSDLSSRSSAGLLRREIERVDLPVVLDFSFVRSLSDSFADEFFAVLVEEKGYDWFAANVKVLGLESDVRETILRAVHLRCETANSC